MSTGGVRSGPHRWRSHRNHPPTHTYTHKPLNGKGEGRAGWIGAGGGGGSRGPEDTVVLVHSLGTTVIGLVADNSFMEI